jgi:cysteine-rich repeat protein
MYGLPEGWDVCVPMGNGVPMGDGAGTCPVFTAATPSGEFCSYPGCDCAVGMGDCDVDMDCVAGTYRGLDNGPAFGLPAGWDVCVAPVCGNGAKEPGEGCDDGNRASNDGCSSSCVVETAYCGNQQIDPGEQCDDGNNNRYDGCVNCVSVQECPPSVPNCLPQ